jgi:hypothetical protein
MKSLVLISFVTVLLASLSAFAQYGNQGSTGQQTSATEQTSTKAISLSGKVGDDGKSFVSDKDNKSWTVSNPEALKGHPATGRKALVRVTQRVSNTTESRIEAEDVEFKILTRSYTGSAPLPLATS